MKLRSSMMIAGMIVVAQVAGCETTGGTPAIRDYCLNYSRVVLTPEERAEVKRLSTGPRRRILANDIDYVCQCTGRVDPICKRS